jgi:hypothetical protein
MKYFLSVSVIVMFGIVVLIHIIKIVYLIFKPKKLEKFKTFSNRHLSTFELVVYYTVAVVFFLDLIFERIERLPE